MDGWAVKGGLGTYGLPCGNWDIGKVRTEDVTVYRRFFWQAVKVSRKEVRGKAGLLTQNFTMDSPMLVIRPRHPDEKKMRRVTINAEQMHDFNPEREIIRLRPGLKRLVIRAYY